MAEPVSKVPYLELSCDELDAELRVAQANLTVAEMRQRNARRKSVGVNFLLLGSGALVDGPQKELAVAKGTVIALTELIDAKCVLPEIQNDTQGN